jgi:alkanesulfonate monooxygenase SsuD/methylene tetrahydromethanopterin reductase-like flavin-dependent oxidoreductase (luciferase family)
MRFAIKTSPQHTSYKDMLAVWQAADDMPIFESGWTFDHFYPIFSDHTGPCLEGWVTTTALAQATKRLRVGVLVTGNVYRHPAVLANMASALEVIVKLLTETTANFDGKHYQLVDAYNEPKPVQKPHPPIVIGGGGEKRTLRTVARWAQHWNVPGGGVDEYLRKRDVLHQHCADIGRDPSEIMTSTHLRLDPNDMDALVKETSAFADAGLDLGIVYLPPPHTAAVLEPLAAALTPYAG